MRRSWKYLSLAAFIALCMALLMTAAAAETAGDFSYELLSEEDKTCTITEYLGDSDVVEIPSVINGYTVAQLGSNAFANCGSIAELKIPASVTSMYWALSGSAVERVVFEAGMEAIPENACDGAEMLREAVIPSSVTSIGSCAFSDCVSLAEITLPSGLISLGGSVFFGCESLTELTVPASVTNMFTSFSGSAIERLVFEAGIEAIPIYACDGAESLREVVIPASVTHIATNAFNGCVSLTEITLPSGLTYIGSCAFSDCESLTEIILPSGLTYMGGSTFSGTGITELTVPASVTIMSGALSESAIERVVFEAGMEAIPESACDGAIALREVVIPSSVTGIGACAFSGCVSLTEITLPSGLTEIGGSVFYDCAGITELTIPASVTGMYWSLGGSAVERVVFETGIAAIPDNACGGAEALREVVIPSSVTSIGSNAFNGCAALTEITLPSSLTYMGSSAFRDCAGITELTIPASVNYMYWALSESAIERVVFEAGMTVIPESACDGAESLQEVTIPDSVTIIGSYAFNECSSLADVYYLSTGGMWKKIEIGSGNEPLLDAQMHYSSNEMQCGEDVVWKLEDGVLTISGTGPMYDYDEFGPVNHTPWHDSMSQITTLIIGDGVTSIGNSTCEFAANLVSVSIPDSVASIGMAAFNQCKKLAQISLPASLEEIGEYAFQQCEALKNVYFMGTREQWEALAAGQTGTLFANASVYPLVFHEGFAATCTEDGADDYYAFDGSDNHSIYGPDLSPLPGIPVISALGHSWESAEYTWSEDYSTLTATRICGNNVEHVETETVKTISQVTVEATCEGKGKTLYTSGAFANEAFSPRSITVEDVPALGHRPVIDAAIAPTAAQTGLTEGSHCSVCGKVLVAQKPVPALNADENPRLSLVTATAVEGNDFVFDVVYDGHDPVVMVVRVIKNGKEDQPQHTVKNHRCTIPADEFVHYEAGLFTLEVRIYDNTSGESMDLSAVTMYERPNPITSAPRLISNENGTALLYYPDAELFVMDNGRVLWPDNGILELSVYDKDGKYAAVVDGKRTAWLDVVISERQKEELLSMEEPQLYLEKSYLRGEPITLTVTGEADAEYSWMMEQFGSQMASGRLPGPGTYSLDLGCLAVTDESQYIYGYWVDFYLYVSKDGYETRSADSQFKIIENEVPSAPTVTILTEEPWYVNQPIRFRVYKENATEYCALYERNGATWVVPASEECEFTFGDDYETGYTIAFSAKVNGVWSEYSETLHLDINDLGELEEPEITKAPAFVLTGSTAQVSWKAVDGAERYRVFAYYENSFATFEQWVTQTTASVPVQIAQNDTMWVNVTASGTGYRNVGDEWKRIAVRKSNGSLSLPSSLLTIDEEAFAGTKASRIVIPSGCKSIGARAFANTKDLVIIRIPASVKTIAESAFDGSGVCVIQTTSGSAAEEFAKRHQIPVDIIN